MKAAPPASKELLQIGRPQDGDCDVVEGIFERMSGRSWLTNNGGEVHEFEGCSRSRVCGVVGYSFSCLVSTREMSGDELVPLVHFQPLPEDLAGPNSCRPVIVNCRRGPDVGEVRSVNCKRAHVFLDGNSPAALSLRSLGAISRVTVEFCDTGLSRTPLSETRAVDNRVDINVRERPERIPA